jgi:hypothetical protein
MDLMAEIKLNADYKRAASAPVWLKGGNVLNGHHAARSSGGARRGGAAGATGPEDWPEDELGESNIRDLADIQVRERVQGMGWCRGVGCRAQVRGIRFTPNWQLLCMITPLQSDVLC